MAGVIRYSGCCVASMVEGGEPYGLIENAEIIVDNGRVVWCGGVGGLPPEFRGLDTINLDGRLVTPALIDCHTHLVYGGNRAREFEMRLQGATYEEIARQGGGILSTVTATREASDEALFGAALKRVDALIGEGVRVIEVKSGYGLTIEDEIRVLRIARALGSERPVTIKTTWLAAHAVPPEFSGDADTYIDDVVIPGLMRAHAEGLVDAVDGFCESIAFTPDQIERVFKAARSLGLRVKLHAEQLTDQKGALLVARYDGLSADHLEHLAEEDVVAFAASGAVAVLLPGAFYTLRETRVPPINALRDQKVPIALATDCNPGSSPITSIRTVMNMGCTLFGLTPEEALAGVTRNAARALGLESEFGVIAPGANAEFAVWDATHPAELAYEIGPPPLHQLISHWNGK